MHLYIWAISFSISKGLTSRQVSDLRKFKDLSVKKCFSSVSKPNWCTLRLLSGCLCIKKCTNLMSLTNFQLGRSTRLAR